MPTVNQSRRQLARYKKLLINSKKSTKTSSISKGRDAVVMNAILHEETGESITAKEALDYFCGINDMSLRDIARTISYAEDKILKIYRGEYNTKDTLFRDNISSFSGKSRKWWYTLKNTQNGQLS